MYSSYLVQISHTTGDVLSKLQTSSPIDVSSFVVQDSSQRPHRHQFSDKVPATDTKFRAPMLLVRHGLIGLQRTHALQN